MRVERLPLDTATEIQQFYRWLEDNSLKPADIALWHALLHISKSAGYPIWISTPLVKLGKVTGMKKDAIYGARDNLEANGLIEVCPGKGSRAAQYRIIPFGEDDQETKQEEAMEDVAESTADQPPTKQEQEEPKRPIPELRPVNVEIFSKIQRLIPMPSPMDLHDINLFMEDGMEDGLLCEAIEIAEKAEAMQNKRPTDKWKYAKGIIRNWFNNGIKTIEEYQSHEKEREEQVKDGGAKQHNRNKQPKAEPIKAENTMREFRLPGQ